MKNPLSALAHGLGLLARSLSWLFVFVVASAAVFAHSWEPPRPRGHGNMPHAQGQYSSLPYTQGRGHTAQTPYSVIVVRGDCVRDDYPSAPTYRDDFPRHESRYIGRNVPAHPTSRVVVVDASGYYPSGCLIGGVVGQVVNPSQRRACQSQSRVVTAPDDLRDARSPEQLREIYGPQGESLANRGW